MIGANWLKQPLAKPNYIINWVNKGVSRKHRPRKHRPQTADLENADLENADLENADLENADLENADLEKINFEVQMNCAHTGKISSYQKV